MTGYMIQQRGGALYTNDGVLVGHTDYRKMEAALARGLQDSEKRAALAEAKVVQIEISILGAVQRDVAIGSNPLSESELRSYDEMLVASGAKEAGARVTGQGGAPTPTTTFVDTGSGESVTVTNPGAPIEGRPGETVANESHIAAAFAPPVAESPAPSAAQPAAPVSQTTIPAPVGKDKDSSAKDSVPVGKDSVPAPKP